VSAKSILGSQRAFIWNKRLSNILDKEERNPSICLILASVISSMHSSDNEFEFSLNWVFKFFSEHIQKTSVVESKVFRLYMQPLVAELKKKTIFNV
jgi:hypothetical protein